jgi:hypothetical protein
LSWLLCRSNLPGDNIHSSTRRCPPYPFFGPDWHTQVLRLSDVEITTKDTVTINIYKQYILTKSPEVQSSACDVDRNGLPPNQRKIYTVNYNKSWLQSMETVSIVIWRKWSPRIQYIVDIWYM